MEIIGLLCPAIVSVLLRERKRTLTVQSIPNLLFCYGIYVMVNVFLTTAVITYGLGLSGVTSEAFGSFSFFIKYTTIALVMAVLIPYVEEIIRKYIKITVTVRAYDEKMEDNMGNCQ